MTVYVVAPTAAASGETDATMASMGDFGQVKCTPEFCATCMWLGGTCISTGPLDECVCVVV